MADPRWTGPPELIALLHFELQRVTVVQETRSAFQQAMRQRFIDEVERLTGREVIGFISDSHVGPDMEIEVFVLEELGPQLPA